jgi:hypothetical protein
MNHFALADEAHIEGDDDGFHLIVETADGDHFNFRIHGFAEEFFQNVKEEIGDWLAEGRRAATSYVPRPTEDDLEGYDRGDPKRVALEREMTRGA